MGSQLNGPVGGGTFWEEVGQGSWLWGLYLVPGSFLFSSLLPRCHEFSSFSSSCASIVSA